MQKRCDMEMNMDKLPSSTITAPMEIEQKSFAIIAKELGPSGLPAEEEMVLKRVIHTTADFDYKDNLYFSQDAVKTGIKALAGGCDIVTDTQMGCSGINKHVLGQLGGRTYCYMSDDDVAAEAKARGETRAVVSMERLVSHHQPYLVAVGNAPTALIRLAELIRQGKLAPVLIIAVPVGFVNVVEAKEMIMSLDVPCIVAKGRKGGSNVAAAICNAMLYQIPGVTDFRRAGRQR